jgi:sugar porter (SP) family MFS transporter
MIKSKAYITRIALSVALGGFLMGFDASVISGVVKFIEPHFDLTKMQLGWAVSCLTLTATLAMMVSGPLSDKFGRRIILKWAAVLYAVSAVLSALAPSFTMLIIARMIGGLGVGASLILAPMYIAEISPAKVRGTMVSFNQLNIVIGISVAFFTNYLILILGDSDGNWVSQLGISKHNWRWMLGLETLPAILYFVFLFFVPESPRWLFIKGRKDEASDILSRVMPEEEVKETIAEIDNNIKKEKNKEKVRVAELFKPSLKLVLLIGVVIAITQQITGINAVFFYAPMIFEQTGIGTDASFSQAILVGLTNLVFTVLAMWMIDKYGRKLLLIIGLSGIVISMGILALSFGNATYKLDSEDIAVLEQQIDSDSWDEVEDITYDSDLAFKSSMTEIIGKDQFVVHESEIVSRAININGWLVLFSIIGFVASFAISLGPVMWVLFSELFPNRVRGLAISFVGFINSGVSFMVQLVFPWELATLGTSTTFLIYGIFGLLGLLFVGFYLPETKGKSLEELETLLTQKN